MHCSETFPVHVGSGSNASFERCRHVGFTPNYGRITAMQRTDALGPGCVERVCMSAIASATSVSRPI